MKELKKLKKNTNVTANSITAYACYTICQCDRGCGSSSSAGMQVNTIGSTRVTA